jgi:hypothetical protein
MWRNPYSNISRDIFKPKKVLPVEGQIFSLMDKEGANRINKAEITQMRLNVRSFLFLQLATKNSFPVAKENTGRFLGILSEESA